MKQGISLAMVVVGAGLLALGFSDYVPAGAGEYSGWSESCRYVMTAGAMLAAGGCSYPDSDVPPAAVIRTAGAGSL